MPKSSDDIQELKRHLTLLARLDGRALSCAEGAVLLEPLRVRDPRPLVEACLSGWPSLPVIQASMELASPPIALTPRLLATAWRNLRVLESSPSLVALTREAPRIFRRYGEIDAAWIARKRTHLARLAEAMGAPEVRVDAREGDPPAWFLRVLEVIRIVHGDTGCAAVEHALARLFKDEEGHRRAARRALEELLACLESGHTPRAEPLAEAVRALREVASLPGRSRARKAAPLLADFLGLPLLNEGHSLDRSLPLAPLVRALGESLLARIPSPRAIPFRDQARRFFASYGLAFDPRPRDGGALHVSRMDIEEGLKKLGPILGQFGGRKLTVAEVLALNGLALGAASSAIAALVEAGLSVDKVRKLAALGRVGDLPKLGEDPATAEAYADWVIALVPHYSALGLDLPLTPRVFERLRVPRREDLAVLAVCLMKHHTRATPEATEQALARLDATLGLFHRRPTEAASIVAELSGTTPGAGRAAFPELAAWLDDDPLLDRFVHLARLAGISAPLSQRLRADFDRDERLRHERAHLSGLRTRSGAQEERLARLEAGTVARTDPARTRRRLADRSRELAALAYERRLDAVFLQILEEVWGISLTELSPGWRDAIRFYLAVDDNHELLGTLLRAAAAGADLARTLPKNRAWLAEARLHLDVDAWLAPRSREVLLGGRPYRIAMEPDPIEILRMGIPFDTCLSLEDGSNAASTVMNAVDANKRVVYLRDARGQIVARKLLAISEEYTLLGYRLYIAENAHREEIARIFQEFCDELATATRLRRAAAGKPRELHPGFWYDDGVVSEGSVLGEEAPVEAWCESLGVPLPRVVTERLRREARVFGALRRGDEAAVLAALRQGWETSGIQARAAQWLLARLPPERLVPEARASSSLATWALRRAAESSPLQMLELAGRIADWRVAEEVVDLLPLFPRTAEVVRAFVSAAIATRRHAERFDDHGLEHQSIYLLSSLVGKLPIAVSLDLCDRVAPLWQWVAEVAPDCEDCVKSAEQHLIEAIGHSYASARDPATVIRYLDRSKVSHLARRAALLIASRYALSEEATARSLPPPRLEPLHPSPSALRALARLRKREPGLDADPAMLAALLRQSGGKPPSHGPALPVPRASPLQALGDLVLQLELTPLLERWPRQGKHAELESVALALTCLDRHLAGGTEDPAAVSAALKTVRSANLPNATYQSIVEWLLLDRGRPLSEEARSLIDWFLRERLTWQHPELTPEMAVALWQLPELRGALVAGITRTADRCFTFSYPCIEAAARRAGSATLVDGLFEAAVEALVDQGRYEALAKIPEESLFRRAMRLALDKVAVAGVISIYEEIGWHEGAAIFLDELSRSRLMGSEELASQLALAVERWGDPEWKMPLEWLQGRIAAASPRM